MKIPLTDPSASARKRTQGFVLSGDESDVKKPPGKTAIRKRPSESITRAHRVLGAKVLSEEKIIQILKGQTRDRQMAMCLRVRYAKWGKCTQCIAKLGGDSCRFKDFRVFRRVPRLAEWSELTSA